MIVKKPWPYQFKMQKIIIRSVAESFFLDPPFEKKKKIFNTVVTRRYSFRGTVQWWGTFLKLLPNIMACKFK
jgi:hypothetical protein